MFLTLYLISCRCASIRAMWLAKMKRGREEHEKVYNQHRGFQHPVLAPAPVGLGGSFESLPENIAVSMGQYQSSPQLPPQNYPWVVHNHCGLTIILQWSCTCVFSDLILSCKLCFFFSLFKIRIILQFMCYKISATYELVMIKWITLLYTIISSVTGPAGPGQGHSPLPSHPQVKHC